MRNTTTPLPPGRPLIWLDAQDIDGFCNATLKAGDKIASWKSKGSMEDAFAVEQADEDMQPVFRQLGQPGNVNNSSSVKFDGVDDHLTSGGIAPVSNPLVYAVVHRCTTVSAGTHRIVAGPYTEDPSIYRTAAALLIAQGGTPRTHTVETAVAGEWALTVVKFDAVPVWLYNGSQVATNSASGASPGMGGLTLGSSPEVAADFFDGDIVDVLVWDDDSYESFAEIVAYFDAKYGISFGGITDDGGPPEVVDMALLTWGSFARADTPGTWLLAGAGGSWNASSGPGQAATGAADRVPVPACNLATIRARRTGVSTSYSNAGGTGNRTGSITVTTSVTGGGCGLTMTPSMFVDGANTFTGSDIQPSQSQTVAGLYIRFQFTSARVITECKWYGTAHTWGDWKWQGSNDGSTWTDIGASFTLGGTAPFQTQTTLSANTTGYLYYQLLGVSGTTVNTCAVNAQWMEAEFKIGNAVGAETVTVYDFVTSAVVATLTIPALAESASTSPAIDLDADTVLGVYSVATGGASNGLTVTTELVPQA